MDIYNGLLALTLFIVLYFSKTKIGYICDYLNISHIIKENKEDYERDIYLGNWFSSKNKDILQEKNIKYILCMNDMRKSDDILNFYKENNITQKYVKIYDLPSSNIYQYFDECYDFIDKANGNILVHCTVGVSRSSTMVIMYLMKKYNMKLNEALQYVINKRCIVRPNSGFYRQLLDFEKDLSL